MKNYLFSLLILLTGCYVEKLPRYYHSGKRSQTQISMDTINQNGTAMIFVRTKEIDTLLFEDERKIRQLQRDIDSIQKATYLVTKNTTAYQDKQQKGYEFYKGVSCVTGVIVVATGLYWLLTGL